MAPVCRSNKKDKKRGAVASSSSVVEAGKQDETSRKYVPSFGRASRSCQSPANKKRRVDEKVQNLEPKEIDACNDRKTCDMEDSNNKKEINEDSSISCYIEVKRCINANKEENSMSEVDVGAKSGCELNVDVVEEMQRKIVEETSEVEESKRKDETLKGAVNTRAAEGNENKDEDLKSKIIEEAEKQMFSLGVNGEANVELDEQKVDLLNNSKLHHDIDKQQDHEMVADKPPILSSTRNAEGDNDNVLDKRESADNFEEDSTSLKVERCFNKEGSLQSDVSCKNSNIIASEIEDISVGQIHKVEEIVDNNAFAKMVDNEESICTAVGGESSTCSIIGDANIATARASMKDKESSVDKNAFCSKVTVGECVESAIVAEEKNAFCFPENAEDMVSFEIVKESKKEDNSSKQAISQSSNHNGEMCTHSGRDVVTTVLCSNKEVSGRSQVMQSTGATVNDMHCSVVNDAKDMEMTNSQISMLDDDIATIPTSEVDVLMPQKKLDNYVAEGSVLMKGLIHELSSVT
eukprot:gene15881-17481_t